MAQYRAKQFDLAIENLQKSNDRFWEGLAKTQNWFVLAMIHQRLGHKEEARECLDTARQMIQQPGSTTPAALVRGDPENWIALHVLSREAEALLADLPSPLAETPRKATLEPLVPRREAVKYVKLIHVATSKVLAVEHDSTDAVARVVLAEDEESQARQWKFEQDGDYYMVVNRYSGKVLDVSRDSSDDGAPNHPV